MSSVLPPSSPGVGVRRKGPKSLPKLPLSAFSPPNSGTSDRFPLAPSPSAIHPSKVIDANVRANGVQLDGWSREFTAIADKVEGVVLSLQGYTPEAASEVVESLDPTLGAPILAVIAPVSLEAGVPQSAPSFSSAKVPVHLSSTFSTGSTEHALGIQWALESGYVVELDIQQAGADIDWDSLEGLVGRAVSGSGASKGAIVLSNLLPPPHSLSLPIVKLLGHPTYMAFQDHISALSLVPNTYVKYIAPSWQVPTPSISKSEELQDLKEWKRRIKMFLGPVVEAFGYERIIFGSSPTPSSTAASNAGDWYEIARECLAEFGLEQADMDAVFYTNARKLYLKS